MPPRLFPFYIGGSLAGVPIYSAWSPYHPLPSTLLGLRDGELYYLREMELGQAGAKPACWLAYCCQDISPELAMRQIEYYLLSQKEEGRR